MGCAPPFQAVKPARALPAILVRAMRKDWPRREARRRSMAMKRMDIIRSIPKAA
jgi:hypothetical protein